MGFLSRLSSISLRARSSYHNRIRRDLRVSAHSTWWARQRPHRSKWTVLSWTKSPSLHLKYTQEILAKLHLSTCSQSGIRSFCSCTQSTRGSLRQRSPSACRRSDPRYPQKYLLKADPTHQQAQKKWSPRFLARPNPQIWKSLMLSNYRKLSVNTSCKTALHT